MKWHRWFAWHPVRLDRFDPYGSPLGESSEFAWLETIWRKGSPAEGYWFYHYHALGENPFKTNVPYLRG